MIYLINRLTNAILLSPRADGGIPEGLDREAYHVLEEIKPPAPEPGPGQEVRLMPPETVIDDPDSQGINGRLIYAWQVVDLPKPEPEQQWLEFVEWLYSQPAMMAAMSAARLSTSPQGEPATTALPAALEAARVQQNYPAFAVTWRQFLLASGLPAEALEPIGAKALACNLPAEFIAALLPEPS